MELNASKIISFICICSCLLVLGLFALWLQWDTKAENQVAAVTSSIEYYNRAWDRQPGAPELSYDEIYASGYPLGLTVRILKPKLRSRTTEGTLMITAPYVDLQPNDSADTVGYIVEYLPDFQASGLPTGGKQEDFLVHLNHLPELFLQKRPADSNISAHITEFGVILPDNMQMVVSHNGKTQTMILRTTRTEAPRWGYIPGDVHTPIAQFHTLLRQIMSNRL